VSDQVETGYAPVAGSKLYYERKGSGTPVVLIHSGFLDRRQWDPQFESYSSQFSVIRYDIRGHGRSPPGAIPYVDADDLRALFDHLGLAHAFVIGNSNGARTASGFAAGSPDRVRGLVLVGGLPGDLDPSQEEERRFADSLPQRDERILALAKADKVGEAVDVMLDAWAPAVDDSTRAYLRIIATDNFAALIALRTGQFQNRPPSYPVAEALRTGPIPIQLICGEQDHPALEMMMGRFAQQLPHGRFVRLVGADHTANLSDRVEFDRVVLDFLATTSTRGGTAA
jgi:pimeloyl-ACP methyl ester carboxylesterase